MKKLRCYNDKIVLKIGVLLLIAIALFGEDVFGQKCEKKMNFAPNVPPGSNVCQGQGEFKFEIIETTGDGCPTGTPYEGTGLQSITFVHEYKSPPGVPAVVNMANVGRYWTMADITRSLAANGAPLEDDKFEITFCDGTTIDLNGDYFAQDDPNTPDNEETYVPYQDGTYSRTVNGESFTGLEQHVPSEGPNSTKKSLPAGTLNIDETLSNTDARGNIGNSRVAYTINNVCAYEVDVTETAYSECYTIQLNQTGNPQVYLVRNSRKEEPITLECDKVNACYGPSVASICGGTVGPYEEFVINLPNIPNYYEVELVVEGNGMSQVSNIGYVSVPSCSTCTTATATIPMSNYYFWDGYYTAYPRVRVYGNPWESGPACSFFCSSYGTRQTRGNNGETQQLESKIFPNPSGNEGFNLELTGLKENDNKVLITIYDLLGKQVHNEQFNSSGTTATISLNSDGKMKPGFYMVNMSVNGEPLKQKIQIK